MINVKNRKRRSVEVLTTNIQRADAIMSHIATITNNNSHRFATIREGQQRMVVISENLDESLKIQ